MLTPICIPLRTKFRIREEHRVARFCRVLVRLRHSESLWVIESPGAARPPRLPSPCLAYAASMRQRFVWQTISLQHLRALYADRRVSVQRRSSGRTTARSLVVRDIVQPRSSVYPTSNKSGQSSSILRRFSLGTQLLRLLELQKVIAVDAVNRTCRDFLLWSGEHDEKHFCRPPTSGPFRCRSGSVILPFQLFATVMGPQRPLACERFRGFAVLWLLGLTPQQLISTFSKTLRSAHCA